jgi:hypothetical protein
VRLALQIGCLFVMVCAQLGPEISRTWPDGRSETVRATTSGAPGRQIVYPVHMWRLGTLTELGWPRI